MPAPLWPLTEHASLGQNCFDASMGSVVVCVCYSMPMDACFFKFSFPFLRLVGVPEIIIAENFLLANLLSSIWSNPGGRSCVSWRSKADARITWQQVEDAVEAATAYWNAHKHPFVWGRRRRHQPPQCSRKFSFKVKVLRI